MIEIIGKNGSGKSYISNRLYEQGFTRNVGYTTRPMRHGEIDGVDYHFISEQEFKEKLANNEFVDHKVLNGNYYGISIKDLTPNSILISGGGAQIEEKTGLKVYTIYIDCDTAKRYKRILKRGDSPLNNFNRFHNESFSYLYDFNALFVDNNAADGTGLKQVKEVINDISHITLTSNREYLTNEVNKFNIDLLKTNPDKLLAMLIYEEYLLRKLFLTKESLTSDIIIEEYNRSLLSFAASIGLNHSFDDNHLVVEDNNLPYHFNYLSKRLVRK